MHPAAEYVQIALAAEADPGRAEAMSAYIHSRQYRRLYGGKDEMPFYGVQRPARESIFRLVRAEFAPMTRVEYEDLVFALWELPHREEKYLAQRIAGAFGEFVVPASMPVYTRFIAEGAWWDFVDESATHLVRWLILEYPDETWPVVDPWIDHEDMWFRRSAIICQVGAKDRTDAGRLFRFCEERMHEREFFIRKAIGWSLREYAKTDARSVAEFVAANREGLSALSYREATKHIGHLVHR